MENKEKEKGFTLVELLVVVSIIGILAGVAVPNFLGAITRARVAKSFADMDAIAKAQEMYFVDNRKYVATTDALTPAYLGATVLTDLWGNPYVIATSPEPNPTMFFIVGMGPDGKPNEPYKDAEANNVASWEPEDRLRGPLGGPEGAREGYGYIEDDWYHPGRGVASSGDIGYGSG